MIDHNIRHTHSIPDTLERGLHLGRQSFLATFPFTFLMSILIDLLQTPTFTFTDVYDWITVGLFFFGALLLITLHAAIVLSISALKKGKSLFFFDALLQGLQKGIWAFIVFLGYALIVVSGLFLFIFPGIYLSIVFFFSFFLALMHEYKEVSLPRQFINHFKESAHLVKNHWWLTFYLVLSLTLFLIAVKQLFFVLFSRQLVLANFICVTSLACMIPFWYSCVLTWVLDLKRQH